MSTESSNQRRKFTKSFKRETLELYARGKKTAAELEEDLGLSKGCISRWKRELANEGTAAFRGQGKLRSHEEELVRLKKENQQLKYERDLLKKAVGIVTAEEGR